MPAYLIFARHEITDEAKSRRYSELVVELSRLLVVGLSLEHGLFDRSQPLWILFPLSASSRP